MHSSTKRLATSHDLAQSVALLACWTTATLPTACSPTRQHPSELREVKYWVSISANLRSLESRAFWDPKFPTECPSGQYLASVLAMQRCLCLPML